MAGNELSSALAFSLAHALASSILLLLYCSLLYSLVSCFSRNQMPSLNADLKKPTNQRNKERRTYHEEKEEEEEKRKNLSLALASLAASTRVTCTLLNNFLQPQLKLLPGNFK